PCDGECLTQIETRRIRPPAAIQYITTRLAVRPKDTAGKDRRRRTSALAMVATQCANTGDEHAGNPAEKHYVAESIMPVAHRSHQQHRAADHESSESDGAREPPEIPAQAATQGFQPWKPAQIAFGDTPEDASRVAGRITYQALHFARQLDCLLLYPR